MNYRVYDADANWRVIVGFKIRTLRASAGVPNASVIPIALTVNVRCRTQQLVQIPAINSFNATRGECPRRDSRSRNRDLRPDSLASPAPRRAVGSRLSSSSAADSTAPAAAPNLFAGPPGADAGIPP